MNDLRCNLCEKIFKAENSHSGCKADISRGNAYHPSNKLMAMISFLHFFAGLPFARLEKISPFFGVRLSKSVQFNYTSQVSSVLGKLISALSSFAGRCAQLYIDDISSKVLSLGPELRRRLSDDALTLRDGCYASILTAVTPENHLIVLYKTGISHGGEYLHELLKNRPPGLPPPTAMTDNSNVNHIHGHNVIHGGCLQHARDRFDRQKKNYPLECGGFLRLFKSYFELDRQSHDLTAETRMQLLAEEGLPILEKIRSLAEDYINSKIAPPDSGMGNALSYFLKHYHTFLLPHAVQGAPVTNNLSEWLTYIVVRYLNNSRFYRSEDGSKNGDTIQSAITTCMLAGRDVVAYLTYCMDNANHLKANPEVFFPWACPKDKVPPMDYGYTFWLPPRPEGESIHEAA